MSWGRSSRILPALTMYGRGWLSRSGPLGVMVSLNELGHTFSTILSTLASFMTWNKLTTLFCPQRAEMAAMTAVRYSSWNSMRSTLRTTDAVEVTQPWGCSAACALETMTLSVSFSSGSEQQCACTISCRYSL